MKCDVCGNDYDRAFKLIDSAQREWTFDSIECAAHAIAPRCAHCGCQVLGHGVDRAETIYCCEHCARHRGDAK